MSAHSHSHDPRVPKAALIGAVALMISSIVVAGYARWEKLNTPEAPALTKSAFDAATSASRLIRFVDLPDGGMQVIDASTGALLLALPAQIDGPNGGFVRGLRRVLAREHLVHEVRVEPTYRLTRWRDGRLTLQDGATGQSIELSAFGHDNRLSFERLLAVPQGQP
jgi:putative photosynthetic complex assembly protein